MLYCVSRTAWRFFEWNSIRDVVLHRENLPARGPFILAVSHLSHLEPAVVSTRVRQRVRWMARAEYYRYWVGRFILDRLGCIRVQRTGVPIRAIRTAIDALNAGEVIGIFPEGGVKVGRASVLRGGALKGGAALLAIRASVPIIPVVVLGTEKLNRVGPWLPWRRGRVYVSFGGPVQPRLDEFEWKTGKRTRSSLILHPSSLPRSPHPLPEGEGTRTRGAVRSELTAQLAREFERLYAELLIAANLRDEDVP